MITVYAKTTHSTDNNTTRHVGFLNDLDNPNKGTISVRNFSRDVFSFIEESGTNRFGMGSLLALKGAAPSQNVYCTAATPTITVTIRNKVVYVSNDTTYDNNALVEKNILAENSTVISFVSISVSLVTVTLVTTWMMEIVQKKVQTVSIRSYLDIY